MFKRSQKEKFAYDFEQPVRELEKELEDLRYRQAHDDEDLSDQIEELEEKRDEKLRDIFGSLDAYQRVKLARHPLRPQSLDYINEIFDEFIELHGDRRYGDDQAIITGFAKLEDRRVMVVAQQKGRDVEEKKRRNFGMPEPEGYRKALLKMQLAEKCGLPIVCFIDTPGAAPSVGAEERGQAMAIAENIYSMAGLKTPIVLVVIGEGCSGGALGMGVGDRFAMLENAYYAVISPEGCAAILWKDGEKAPEAAEALKLTANDMLEQGIIDEVLPEPLGGAHRNPRETAETLKDYIGRTLDDLGETPIDELVEERYTRYRELGVYAP